MQHYSALNFEYLDSIEFTITTTNKKEKEDGEAEEGSESKSKRNIQYLNVPAAFDIETTSYTTHEGNKVAFMWVWAFTIGDNKEVFYGRKWEEFLDVCGLLQRKYQLGIGKRLVIYVHNLGFEFQFMKHWFSWIAKDSFAIDKGMPLKMLSSYGIEFRCSWKLTNSKLADVARNLIDSNIKKMEGDLDYELVRHHNTPFTEKEAGYIENDVLIVAAQIAQEIKFYGSMDQIPMTNTGRVRKLIKSVCLPRKNKAQFDRYRKLMKLMSLTPEIYTQLKQTFIGGFTHSNPIYTGHVLDNVSSYDIASSYPAVMASEKFPCGPFVRVKLDNIKTVDDFIERADKYNYAFIFKADIVGLRNIIHTESYLSESKCQDLKGAVICNGRVFDAESLTVCLTEVDLKIMRECYEWDSIKFYDVYGTGKQYLPKPFLMTMLELYARKTELKGVKGREVDYMHSKGMINSMYGMCVTDIVKDSHNYLEDGWSVEPADLDKLIANYNKPAFGRCLSYPWGVYITAYARYNLWKVILELGADYIYSDTDSVKIMNADKYKDLFFRMNSVMAAKLSQMCKTLRIDEKLTTPKTKTGVVKPLGVWEYEGTYELFKTLGAKRYMTYNKGKWELTLAGLSKKDGMNYLVELGNNDPVEIFKLFDNNLYVPPDNTGKKTHFAVDTPYSLLVTDYLGNTEEVTTLSGLHLSECEFTLSISERTLKYIEDRVKGQRYIRDQLI